MKIQETLRKPMLEAKYLNVDNTDRYRPIIRLFYLNYEKLKYWMYQEEVYEELREDPYFKDYTPEQCQQDLAALTAWGNLAAIQDTRRVSSIEEFKNKSSGWSSGWRISLSKVLLWNLHCWKGSETAWESFRRWRARSGRRFMSGGMT